MYRKAKAFSSPKQLPVFKALSAHKSTLFNFVILNIPLYEEIVNIQFAQSLTENHGGNALCADCDFFVTLCLCCQLKILF